MLVALFWIVLVVLIMVGFSAPPPVAWYIAALVGLLGAHIAALNWVVLLTYHRTGRRSSRMPLLGACWLMIALAMAPAHGLRAWLWLPFVVDPGSLLLFVQLAWYLVTHKRREQQPTSKPSE